jgi:hypothetical protein
MKHSLVWLFWLFLDDFFLGRAPDGPTMTFREAIGRKREQPGAGTPGGKVPFRYKSRSRAATFFFFFLTKEKVLFKQKKY